MIKDKTQLECKVNTKIKSEQTPDYQDILNDVQSRENISDSEMYIHQQNHIERIFQFWFKKLQKDKEPKSKMINKPQAKFNAFYQVRSVINSHFQLHYNLNFISEQNILYTSNTDICAFNLIKGTSKKIYPSKQSKFVDHSSKHNLILSNDQKTACVFNMKTKEIHNPKIYEDDEIIGRMSFMNDEHHDSVIQVVGNDLKVILIDIETFKKKQELNSSHFVNDACFMKKHKAFVFAMDGTDILLVDDSGNKKKFIGHKQNNFAVVSISDNVFASGGEDDTVKIWDIRNGKECMLNIGLYKSIYALKYNKNRKKLLALQHGFDFHILDINNSAVVKHSIKHLGTLSGIDFSPNGGKLAVGISTIRQGISVFDIIT